MPELQLLEIKRRGRPSKKATNGHSLANGLGLKWPEMRIVALTRTARMIPCASATEISPACICVAWAAMIAAPPKNTSAKVPTNSETK